MPAVVEMRVGVARRCMATECCSGKTKQAGIGEGGITASLQNKLSVMKDLRVGKIETKTWLSMS